MPEFIFKKVTIIHCINTDGIKRKKLDVTNYSVYRPTNGGKVARAALLFENNSSSYKYGDENYFKGKIITENDIKTKYKTERSLNSLGFCRNCLSFSTGKNISLSYDNIDNCKYLSYKGKAISTTLKQGDILISKPLLGKNKSVVYIGDAKLPNKDITFTPKSSLYTFKKRTNTSLAATQGGEYGWCYKAPINLYPVNPSSGGNCTWYAYGRFFEVMAESGAKSKDKIKGLTRVHPGNAYTFADTYGQDYGWGLIPKPGAIICWGYYGSASGDPGHVAFVEAVNMSSDGKTIKSIEVSQSGWSAGAMSNAILYPGDGKRGTKAYSPGYYDCYFKGFIYNPVDFGNPAGALSGKGSMDDTTDTDIDMQKRSSILYSSDNFKYINRNKEDNSTPVVPSFVGNIVASLKESINNLTTLSFETDKIKKTALSSLVSETIVKNISNIVKNKISLNRTSLSVAQALVEAPFAEIEFSNGVIIGSIKGTTDEYPNYISGISVDKINGVINQYTIKLIYQVRPGEDPNLLDEILSSNKFNKITLRYGDSNSNFWFNDTNLIITNVSMDRDYSGARISYTISATSAGDLVKTYTTNFPAIVDKPSNVIRHLLYENAETSPILLDAFSGMVNRTLVESTMLIPNNDAVLDIDAQTNIDLLSYINYLVGCMCNNIQSKALIRNSSYYIYYMDNYDNKYDGAYFKIQEVTKDVSPYGLTNNIYEIDINYPDNNFIMDFSISTNNCWATLYNNRSPSSEYVYTISNEGLLEKQYSLNLVSSSNIINEINKNWWSEMTTFPISAELTLKGLLKPVMLTSYLKINTYFYGQPHISSGVYVVTGQRDELTSAGFKTTLNIVRVGDS